jgi:hypothetical protein
MKVLRTSDDRFADLAKNLAAIDVLTDALVAP